MFGFSPFLNLCESVSICGSTTLFSVIRDLHLQAAGSRVAHDLFELAGSCIVDPFLAALGADRGAHLADDHDSTAEFGAERCLAVRLFPSAERANVVLIAHSLFLVL